MGNERARDVVSWHGRENGVWGVREATRGHTALVEAMIVANNCDDVRSHCAGAGTWPWPAAPVVVTMRREMDGGRISAEETEREERAQREAG